jgi:DNA repair protein RadC
MVLMKRVLDMCAGGRPREKLRAKGVAALSDFELLQVLIGSGNKQASVSEVAKNMTKYFTKI